MVPLLVHLFSMSLSTSKHTDPLCLTIPSFTPCSQLSLTAVCCHQEVPSFLWPCRAIIPSHSCPPPLTWLLFVLTHHIHTHITHMHHACIPFNPYATHVYHIDTHIQISYTHTHRLTHTHTHTHTLSLSQVSLRMSILPSLTLHTYIPTRLLTHF